MFSKLDKVFLLDGATGTELQKRGMEKGACPETWVLKHPEALRDIQRAYAEAGSAAVYAPTFGANRANLRSHGVTESVASLCRSLVELSRSAVPEGVLVAGDIAPTGLQLLPFGSTDFEELVDIFTEQASALEESGVDFFAIETQMSLPEARAALIAVKRVSKKPVVVSFACSNPSGRSVMGTDLTAALLAMQELGADAYGVNCCGDLGLLTSLLGKMQKYSRLPLIAKPNAGLPDMTTGTAEYGMTPEELASSAAALVQNGAALIGGCCGTTAEHIAALKRECASLHPVPPSPVKTAVAASQSRVADIDYDTEIIEKEITDELLDSMAEVLGEGGEVMKLHVRSEEDIERIDECQYGLSLPLCVSFEDEALRAKFQRVYHGKAHIV